jgi:hypothetical protein
MLLIITETTQEIQENQTPENRSLNRNVQEFQALSKIIDFTLMIKNLNLMMELILEYLTKHRLNLPLVAKLLEILMPESLETL